MITLWNPVIHWSLGTLATIFLLGAFPSVAEASIINVHDAKLSMTYDGNALADITNGQSWVGLDSFPTQDFMRFGKWWAPTETVKAGPTYLPKAPQLFRPIAGSGRPPLRPNFRDDRATLDPLFPKTSPTLQYGVNGTGPVANSEGRNRQSSDLVIDSSTLTGTGALQTNGVAAWWFANDAIVNFGGAWVSWGDLAFSYDASHAINGYSGWKFTNQLGGELDIFDTKNVVLTTQPNGLISITGDLYSTSGFGDYTLVNEGTEVGSFTFATVPEPSSFLLLSGMAAVGCAFVRRRGVKNEG